MLSEELRLEKSHCSHHTNAAVLTEELKDVTTRSHRGNALEVNRGNHHARTTVLTEELRLDVTHGSHLATAAVLTEALWLDVSHCSHRINLLHVHLVRADLIHFLIAESW